MCHAQEHLGHLVEVVGEDDNILGVAGHVDDRRENVDVWCRAVPLPATQTERWAAPVASPCSPCPGRRPGAAGLGVGSSLRGSSSMLMERGELSAASPAPGSAPLPHGGVAGGPGQL